MTVRPALGVRVVPHDLGEVPDLPVPAPEIHVVRVPTPCAVHDDDGPRALRVVAVAPVVDDAVRVEPARGRDRRAGGPEGELPAPLVHVVVALEDEVDLEVHELVEHGLAHRAGRLRPDRDAILVEGDDDPRDPAGPSVVHGGHDPVVVGRADAVVVSEGSGDPRADLDEAREGRPRGIVEVVLRAVPQGRGARGQRHAQGEGAIDDELGDVAACALARVVVPRDDQDIVERALDRGAPARLVGRVPEVPEADQEPPARGVQAFRESEHVGIVHAVEVPDGPEQERGLGGRSRVRRHRGRFDLEEREEPREREDRDREDDSQAAGPGPRGAGPCHGKRAPTAVRPI